MHPDPTKQFTASAQFIINALSEPAASAMLADTQQALTRLLDERCVLYAESDSVRLQLARGGLLTLTATGEDPSGVSLADLIKQVYAHPDYVFGTVFMPGDFPDGQVPEDFPAKVLEDRLNEIGNAMIADGILDDEDDDEADGASGEDSARTAAE